MAVDEVWTLRVESERFYKVEFGHDNLILFI